MRSFLSNQSYGEISKEEELCCYEPALMLLNRDELEEAQMTLNYAKIFQNLFTYLSTLITVMMALQANWLQVSRDVMMVQRSPPKTHSPPLAHW